MRAGFILSEVGIGLRRNLTMTFAVVVTVAISLSLLGIGLLSNSQVRVMKDYWYDKIEVSVYLCGSLSDSPSPALVELLPQSRDLRFRQILKNFQLLKRFITNHSLKHLSAFRKDLKIQLFRKMSLQINCQSHFA
ncbi:MAG: hypothetical protein RIS32_650 [Actinomycetota bacterium]